MDGTAAALIGINSSSPTDRYFVGMVGITFIVLILFSYISLLLYGLFEKFILRNQKRPIIAKVFFGGDVIEEGQKKEDPTQRAAVLVTASKKGFFSNKRNK